MPKCLVIVESASKAKTIQKYLNDSPELKHLGDFEVLASLGHVMDLPMKKMGVNLTTWKTEYTVNEQRKSVIDKIVSTSKKATRVYIASDPDREGEAIAQHLFELLESHKQVSRVAFNEITMEALTKAILEPRSLDKDLIEAQETRRILDRVVGYESSPLIWRRFATTKLSAGRVQSAALKLIVDRYEAFVKHEFSKVWHLEGKFALDNWKEPLVAKHFVKNDKGHSEFIREDDVTKMMSTLKKSNNKSNECSWKIVMTKREAKRRPPAPLTTSTLQQEVYSKHGIPIAMTMSFAQQLYEAGYITYMRTDSTNLSKDAQNKISNWIRENVGEDMVQPRIYKTKVANAQEAHEAIRPTKIGTRSQDLKGAKIQEGHRKVYEIIWRRAVASQMKDALFMELQYTIENHMSELKSHQFRGSQDVLIEPGYMAVLHPEMKVSQSAINGLEELMEASTKEGVCIEPIEFLFDADVVRPTPLFQEPSLVKTLEKESIGRPSTYASILKKLYDRAYVLKGPSPAHVEQVMHKKIVWGSDNSVKIEETEETKTIGGKENNLLIPTSLGQRVSVYLEEVLPIMVESEFTAKMENELDEISRGELSKETMLDTFYKKFHPFVEKAFEIQKKIAAEKKKEAKENPKEKTELTPSNVLKEFGTLHANIVQTRFGPALFHTEEKRFVSIIPLLQWKKKLLDEITQTDVRFLLKMPIKIEETDIEIHMGRYGLYLKKPDENIHLPKQMWDKVYTNDISRNEIEAVIKEANENPPKKRTFRKKFSKKKSN